MIWEIMFPTKHLAISFIYGFCLCVWIWLVIPGIKDLFEWREEGLMELRKKEGKI